MELIRLITALLYIIFIHKNTITNWKDYVSKNHDMTDYERFMVRKATSIEGLLCLIFICVLM